MKLYIAALFTLLLVGIGFSACDSETKIHARSIYMLLDSSKKSLANKQDLSNTFAHVINDLSPGDSLAINTGENILSVDFSKNASQAYLQKRDFRRKVLSYFKSFKPKFTEKFLPSIAKAKAYFKQQLHSKKSIIYFNPRKSISVHTNDLDGYTVSMFSNKESLSQFSHLKTKVETANGQFILASNIDELNLALSYK